MKKVYFLSVLLALSSSFYVNAQFGIQVNGVYFSNGSTVEISCNSGPLQFLVSGYSGTRNSNNYSFTHPPGWQVTASPSDYNRTLQPDLTTGGAISFNRLLLAANGSIYDVTVYLNIVRNTPNNLSVTGANLICNGQTKTYNLSGTKPGDQISWSTNLTGSSTSNSLQATIGSAYEGSYVTANVTTASGCGTFSPSTSVWAATPGFQKMSYGTQGTGQTNFLNTVNFVSSGTWYVIRSNTDQAQLSSGVSWSPNVSVNGYTVGNHEYRLNLTSGQSVNMTVNATNPCGSSSRTFTFVTSSGYRVYPNPAKEVAYIEFDNATYGDALPERVELLSEKSTKPIKSVDVQKAFASKSLQGGNRISFDVKDLPRGTYYMHIINSKNKDKELDAVRILLE